MSDVSTLSPVLLVFIIVVGIWLLNSIKILREYERGVIFRLGRVLSEPKGPGLIFVFSPFVLSCFSFVPDQSPRNLPYSQDRAYTQ